jgi:nucleoside-diphosphate-sugar epimerase
MSNVNRMRVLVTGAGGFIGGWVAEEFSLSGAYAVRAGIRRWGTAARVARFPVEVVGCNVLEPREIDRAVKGVDAVIHCAYGDQKVTIDGTEHLLSACMRHGVRRVVHISTIDVYGPVEGEVDESHAIQMTGSAYGDSKASAEAICREYLRKGVPVSILRPTIVYGPHSKLWIVKFVERLQSGRWHLFGEIGEGHCSLVYVRDLVSAIRLALHSEEAVGEAFNVSGPEVITWNKYFTRMNNLLGLPTLRSESPAGSRLRARIAEPIKGTARFVLRKFGPQAARLYQNSARARILMKGFESRLSAAPGEGELRVFANRGTYSIRKARERLGYSPRFDVEQGLIRSIEWYRHERAL